MNISKSSGIHAMISHTTLSLLKHNWSIAAFLFFKPHLLALKILGTKVLLSHFFFICLVSWGGLSCCHKSPLLVFLILSQASDSDKQWNPERLESCCILAGTLCWSNDAIPINKQADSFANQYQWAEWEIGGCHYALEQPTSLLIYLFAHSHWQCS